jgi:hypothetical protein
MLRCWRVIVRSGRDKVRPQILAVLDLSTSNCTSHMLAIDFFWLTDLSLYW